MNKAILDEMYSLKNIIRYNNLPRIKDESVAEHSYFVALIVTELYKEYRFDLGKALLTAIVHDIAEIWISDIPRNIKNNHHELELLMDKIELNIVKEKYPEHLSLIKDFNYKRTIEGLIVKLADCYSVLQYAEQEVKLGSTFYMPDVIKQAKKYIKILEKTLRVCKR